MRRPILFVLLTSVVAAPSMVAQQPPTFRAGVELVAIDVQIIPAKNALTREFTVADFEVKIGGRRRPAVSATLVHDDDGPVTRDSSAKAATSECVFGFQRRKDVRTVHYLVGVEPNDADWKDMKALRIKVLDKTFVAQRYVWRFPLRK